MNRKIKMSSAMLAGTVISCVLLAAQPALAWNGRVSWTTWLRAGPGKQFVVLDEVLRGDTLEVLGCNSGWCQVSTARAAAFIPQDLLTQADTAAPPVKPANPADCFTGRWAGYGRGESERYCPG